MEIGSIKNVVPAYQGSGLESSAVQRTVPQENGTSQKAAPQESKAAVAPENSSERKSSPENKVTDVQDPSRNDSVKRAVEEINRRSKNSEAVFGIHEETNRVTIKIVDKETKEIIKEFPPEETLDMIAKVWELAGLMVDEKR